jgi:hypothetical protein
MKGLWDSLKDSKIFRDYLYVLTEILFLEILFLETTVSWDFRGILIRMLSPLSELSSFLNTLDFHVFWLYLQAHALCLHAAGKIPPALVLQKRSFKQLQKHLIFHLWELRFVLGILIKQATLIDITCSCFTCI